MSITKKSPGATINQDTVKENQWVRPSDWLPTTVTAGENKIQALVAVLPGSTSTHFTVTVASGNFTVDWGDGSSTENFNASVVASHQYTWASVSGTDTSKGYRQALVTITPQASQTFTSIDFTQPFQTDAYGSTMLELVVGNSITTLVLYNVGSIFRRQRWLEHIKFLSSVTFSATSVFRDCSSLQCVEGTITASSSCANWFNNDTSLRYAPMINTSAATSTNTMFISCYSLEYVPHYDLSSCTNTGNMFTSCYRLKTVPLLDLTDVTDASLMFSNCFSLEEVPPFNTPALTVANQMFNACYQLKEIPLLDTSGVADFTSFAASCASLKSFPAIDTSSATNMTSMFSACSTLESVPSLTTTSVTNTSSMFTNCYSLETVGSMTTTSVTNMSSMFNNCYNLRTISGTLDMAGVSSSANATNAFTNCYNLREFTPSGMRFTWSIANLALDTAAVDALYTALPTITAQTITVTDVWGAVSATPGTATGKGWTVTGP